MASAIPESLLDSLPVSAEATGGPPSLPGAPGAGRPCWRRPPQHRRGVAPLNLLDPPLDPPTAPGVVDGMDYHGAGNVVVVAGQKRTAPGRPCPRSGAGPAAGALGVRAEVWTWNSTPMVASDSGSSGTPPAGQLDLPTPSSRRGNLKGVMVRLLLEGISCVSGSSRKKRACFSSQRVSPPCRVTKRPTSAYWIFFSTAGQPSMSFTILPES